MITRRTLITHPLALAAASTIGPAFSQSSRPIKVIVPSAAATGADAIARFMADALQKSLHLSSVVENYPGGGGVIGTNMAAKALPDGNTLLVTNVNFYLAPWIQPKVAYDPIKDFAPVASFCNSAQLMFVGPNSPYSSLKEIIAASKQPGASLSYASAGNGSFSHICGTMLNNIAGTKLEHVPYKSPSQGLLDVSEGRVTLGFLGVAGALPLIKSGKLKLIAVGSPRRSIYLPDAPTLAEAGAPGFDATSGVLVLAPAGTPAAVIQRLSKAMTDAAESTAFKEFIATQGLEPEILSTAEFTLARQRDAEKWKKLVELTGTKPT